MSEEAVINVSSGGPQAKEISQLVCDSRDRVRGLTLEGVYFIFDPGTGDGHIYYGSGSELWSFNWKEMQA